MTATDDEIDDGAFDFDATLRDFAEWMRRRRDRLAELADASESKAERGQLIARVGELDACIEESDERLGA